ncbi:hypothetical protein M9458_026231, partial [Cirrhinus mrigala]
DWPGFDRLFSSVTQPVSPRGSRRNRKPARGPRRRPTLLASDSGRDGEMTGSSIVGPKSESLTAATSYLPRILSYTSWSKTACCTVRNISWCGPRVGTLTPYGWPPRSGEHRPAHPGPLPLTWSRRRGKTVLPSPPPSPLIPLPIIDVPFERIGMDLVGPLPKSARGHEHILVVVDYATRYPEAVPLRKVTAKNIAQELFQLLSRVGIPTEILTDQGTPFMSRLMADLCRLLRVKQKDWDLMLPYVLFGIREVPQASTGFTPFERLFGRQPRGLLDVAKEAWEQQPARHRSNVEHVQQMREKIDRVMPAQRSQQRHYDRAAQPREFQPGDRVMVLVPTAACKFLATWQGPYTVVERIGPVTYQRTVQVYHVNLLKKWVGTRDQLAAFSTSEPVVVDMNPHLSAAQKGELQHLIGQFSDVFSPLPGRTNILHHDIRTPGLIELLRTSPIVMVPKPDGTLRFCNDFRRLNEVSEFDGYPMPRVDELLDRLGQARYISTLDLTKGYWQVPLSESAKPKTAFSTPNGHWQYRTLPFGLHGAPASFQRLMDIILRPHQPYAAAYLDDVVIHSEAWEDHLDRLRRVLTALRKAGLTANPRKCHLAFYDAKYLGYQVGRGLIRPQEKKVEAVRTAPKPKSKTQVQAFLGLAGYYRCFIPNFSSLAAPLTDLTRKGQPEKVQWSPEADKAFREIKKVLTSEPVLCALDFSCPFLLQTDASDTGLGAVLSQVQEGEEHPVLYISRKLTSAERNYATVEKEALAIKWAVLELRYYLLGRKFTLVTDHAPLQWMAKAKNTNARVTRWFLALQDFHFEVKHRAGAANNNADGLSRIWATFAGLSGVTPHPPLLSPLLTRIIRRTRTTLRGGECDECPEEASASPWKQTSSTHSRSLHRDRSQLRLINWRPYKRRDADSLGERSSKSSHANVFSPSSTQRAADDRTRLTVHWIHPEHED